MGDYQTVVVGTDGSASSLRAVDHAARLASGPGARLIVVSAYQPEREDRAAADALKEDAYLVTGKAHAYTVLRQAAERARAAGAGTVEERPIIGAPVDVLLEHAQEAGADLLVVGNVGLNTVAGRLLGSVPTTVCRRAKIDVLIVHTTN